MGKVRREHLLFSYIFLISIFLVYNFYSYLQAATPLVLTSVAAKLNQFKVLLSFLMFPPTDVFTMP